MKINEIDDTHEDEVRGMNVSLGNVETESNGHKEGRVESIDLVETIKSLQRDVLSYKVDNEKLMKSREKNNINTKLLQSLDNLQKRWIRNQIQGRKRIIDLIPGGKNLEVLVESTSLTKTLNCNTYEEQKAVQVCLLSDNIRGGLE
jgi:hypothetical protein